MKVLLVLLPLLSLASAKLFGSCGTLSKECASDSTSVSSDEYLLLSAAEKNTIIWDNCKQDTTSAPWFSSLELTGLFKESMCSVFKTQGDELPWEKDLVFYGWRKKYIHTVGTVGQVEWRNLGDHPYTGLFEGATQGIVRFSLAKEPSPESNATAPGLGLKLLRDGMDSANLVAMYSVDGQDSWNFFKNNFTNHIAPAGLGLVPIALKFSQATNNVQQVALSDFAQYGQTGTTVAEPNFPYMLTFQPTGEFTFPDNYVRPFTEDLTSIPSGSTLYKVWALDQPTELGGTEKHIADLVLVSDMITSLWGDQHLFFRHQDMVEDSAIKPEWEEYLETFGLPSAGCPAQRAMQAGRLGDN
eukprot:TRINITY_DN4220_c0_g1_i2.p1 TRINITY_DN4220_c0_g1~~TRINITY_DN4220_c0_g1_i2.p1  ORF type:complete len:357 (-),score=107.20 TRINITY_DN4220_c0_g1_i2:86-1156(-)